MTQDMHVNLESLKAGGIMRPSVTPAAKKPAGTPAARSTLRACEWRFIEQEFPLLFDLDASPTEMKTLFAMWVCLLARGGSLPDAAGRDGRSGRRMQALGHAVHAHPDGVRLVAELQFVAAARLAIGRPRINRADCAVCSRLVRHDRAVIRTDRRLT